MAVAARLLVIRALSVLRTWRYPYVIQMYWVECSLRILCSCALTFKANQIHSSYCIFCWPYIWIYACNETNLMYYLSSVYSVTIPLHVSGLLVVHHQEVTMHICDNWYVLYVLVDCRRADFSGLRRTTHTNCHIYTLLPPDDGLLTSPKHVEVKGKAIPLQAWRDPEGSRRLRLPDFKTSGTWRWQGCQPYAPAAFTPRKYSWYSFMLEAESTPGP
jgi:hypothetical protein